MFFRSHFLLEDDGSPLSSQFLILRWMMFSVVQMTCPLWTSVTSCFLFYLYLAQWRLTAPDAESSEGSEILGVQLRPAPWSSTGSLTGLMLFYSGGEVCKSFLIQHCFKHLNGFLTQLLTNLLSIFAPQRLSGFLLLKEIYNDQLKSHLLFSPPQPLIKPDQLLLEYVPGLKCKNLSDLTVFYF